MGSTVQPLQLLPALDVCAGRAVGRTDDDPVTVALTWQEQGAEWIHLVDLDLAFGRGHNRAMVNEIVGRLDIDVQLSGGIDDPDSLAAALATGCRRVNLATSALARPDWCAAAIAEHGDRIAIGLDVRGQALAPRGRDEPAGDLDDALTRLDAQDCARYVVTDVERDGSLDGPNLDLLTRVCAATGRPVVASGGVSNLADVRALVGLVDVGVEGAVVGTALHQGRFTLEEALAATGLENGAGAIGWSPPSRQRRRLG